ncbi:DegT/DnrJ/EryC1/StrS aminotransferase family protein [Psychroflexus salis]|uniref:Uncharacterized protein n=1 Tax=Psychroflexus salis TaxID=1526574 RepID=A0A916ZMJ2_9FLAO|nr:DegT/DnrJ/EryC1/StrS aminotransferase family protein [Psychroflexus salis]GGE05075.1 hypothetical protein GCM10010831_03410 [Psychroflexus salis]
MILNNYIVEEITNNHPSFLIIPSRKKDIFKNASIARNNDFDLLTLLQKRYPDKYVTLTKSGKDALRLVYENTKQYNGKGNTIIKTTSNNFYISGCVTKTIEMYQNWTRHEDTKSNYQLFNHEFGYADNSVMDYKSDKIVIEDCAYSFNSRLSNNELCGTKSNYSIFSFSKFFPIQLGGFLLSDTPVDYKLENDLFQYISSVVGYYFNKIEYWTSVRRKIFNYYSTVFSQLGFKPFFMFSENSVPGVFLFTAPKEIDLDLLKKYYWTRGIQCSVFYGKQAFYLPLNQFIEKSHVDYFASILKSFLKRYNY